MAKNCDNCGDTNFYAVIDLGMQPLAENDNGKSYPLTLVECEECGLIQLTDIPPRDEVFPPDHPYTTGNSSERRRHFRKLAEDVLVWGKAGFKRGLPGELWVDIGANDGTLLRAVRELAPGMKLVGVEPTKQARKCDDPAISMREEFFSWESGNLIAQEHGQAQIITACNVLAHVPDLHGFLSGVRHLLADDGVFITESHDWNSISRGLQIDTIYHEHLRYFSLATLTDVLAYHGLSVVNVERIEAHGGSFRVYAMAEPVDLVERAENARESLQGLLTELSGPVYGIGATTRATPLIHYMDIADYITCVCEIATSDKIGTCIPGTDIPIVDEKVLIEQQPPYALVLSWHIKYDIMNSLRDKGYQGNFIIPLPEPTVVEVDGE